VIKILQACNVPINDAFFTPETYVRVKFPGCRCGNFEHLFVRAIMPGFAPFLIFSGLGSTVQEDVGLIQPTFNQQSHFTVQEDVGWACEVLGCWGAGSWAGLRALEIQREVLGC
jgi:hypothetical protein